MKIAENAHLLEIAFAGHGKLSTALLEDQNNLVLVDCGFPGQFGGFREQIGIAGRSVAAMTGIIFTHQDLDHIGCARDFLAESGGITTMAHEDEIKYIEGSATPAKMAKKEADGNLSEADRDNLENQKANYSKYTVGVSRGLKDGEILDICGGIEVVHVPGHTPGHICLLLKQSGILLSGDALNLSQGRLAGPNPIHTMDMEMALKSLRRLIGMPIRAVLTYHGGLFEGDVKAELERLTAGV